MAKTHGTRFYGDRRVKTMLDDGSATAKGDLVQTVEATGTDTITPAATGAAVFGFALEAITASSTGDVDRLMPGDQFWVYVSAGTVAASEMGKYADIVNELSITLTESNNDCRIMGWDGATTDYCIVEFTSPETAVPTLAI